MGKIIRRDETDEAKFHLRFKGIEVYHEYDSIADFVKDWQDYDEFMETEVEVLSEPKSEARRLIDLFLKNTKHIPTETSAYWSWKNSEKE